MGMETGVYLQNKVVLRGVGIVYVRVSVFVQYVYTH